MLHSFFRRAAASIAAVLLTLTLLCGTAAAASPSYKTIAPASAFAGGTGTEKDPYRIENAEQLALLSALHSDDRPDGDAYYGKCFALSNDVFLNDISNAAHWDTQPPEYAWTPIGLKRPFTGVFDGQGHAIRGMFLVAESDKAGLFSNVSEAVIRNCSLTEAFLRVGGSADFVGSVAGCADESSITGCTVQGRIESTSCLDLGGVVGWARMGVLSDCAFDGTIHIANTGVRGVYAGGVAGAAEGMSLTDCINRGVVVETAASSRSASYVGGVVGSLKVGSGDTASSCINQGTVSACAMSVGGVIGCLVMDGVLDLQLHSESQQYKSVGTIADCINRGQVRGTTADSTGGVIGSVMNHGRDEGALTIQGCVNNGRVTGKSYVGGIIGDCEVCSVKWSILDCVNNGSVLGVHTIGGIAGYVTPAYTPSQIARCRNTGAVLATEAPAGGIVGHSFGFSVLTGNGDRAPLTIASCVNTGPVSSQSGITGTGGILGSLHTDTEVERVFLLSCLNKGTVSGEKSVAAGGILGSGETAVGGHYEIRDCANTGSIVQGDGKNAYTHGSGLHSTIDNETFQSAEALDMTILMLGSSSLGGIVGVSKKGVVENCVNAGPISAQTGSGYYQTVSDMMDVSVNEDEMTYTNYLFAGSICGLYFYLEGDPGYAPAFSRLKDCSYINTHPLYTFLLPPGTGVGDATLTNIRAVSAAEAEALIAKLFPPA